jgi:hypothetical protein
MNERRSIELSHIYGISGNAHFPNPVCKRRSLTTPNTGFQACFRTALWRFLYNVMTNSNKNGRPSCRVAEAALFT